MQKGKMKKFAVKVEEGKEGRDGLPSVGPVYRNLIAEHAFPATDPALGTAWEMFRYFRISLYTEFEIIKFVKLLNNYEIGNKFVFRGME